MEPTISQMLKSPAFWFGTVVVGLIIEVVGSYFYSRVVEKWLSGWSEKRQKKFEQKKAAYRQKVEELSKDPTDLIIGCIRVGVGICVVITIMTAITIASFVVGIRYPSGRGSLAFNLIFLSLFA